MSRFEELIIGLFWLLAAIFLVWLAGTLVLYVLKALALQRLARNAGLQSPGLAWVPVANDHLLGLLCDRALYCHAGRRWNFSVILPVVDLVRILGGSAVPFLFSYGGGYPGWLDHDLRVLGGSLLALLSTAAMAVALFYLFCDYAPGREALYTALSVVFGGLAQSVLLMVIRDRVPLSVQRGGAPSQPAGQGYPPGGPTPWGQAPYGGTYTPPPGQPPYGGQAGWREPPPGDSGNRWSGGPEQP